MHPVRQVNCGYPAKSKLVAFLLSFFCGLFGVDWFYLSNGSGGMICAGISKILTGGGCLIWALVDWIRVLSDGFSDSNGAPLWHDI